MQLSLKRLIGMIFILAFGITFFVMMFPQTNTVSIHEIRNNDFPREYIAESYRHYLELEIDQYGRIKGGLRGFFEEDIDSLNEYLDAIKNNDTKDKKWKIS